MMTWCFAMLRISIICLLIPTAASFHSLLCHDPHKPMINATSYVRRIDSTPYRLHVTKDSTNLTQAGTEQYRVEISSENSLLKFVTAQIAVVKTETCGYGELSFTRTGFYKEAPASSLCPVMLVTTAPEKMHKSPPLLWKPPSCGCVQFRVLVFEDKTSFYRDNEGINNGYLTTTVCVKKREERKQYINALCRIRSRYSAAEIVNRHSFNIRHGLRDRALDKRALVAAYEERLKKVDGCCSEETETLRSKCLDRTRFYRVDRLCEEGLPDISLTELRRAHTRKQEKKCCFILGSFRYKCFNHKSKFPASSSEAGVLDYSMDETDPLNDLADIATRQDGDILSMLSRLEFGAEFESDGGQSVNMRDHGSKQISSEEKSSAISVERTDSRSSPVAGLQETGETQTKNVKEVQPAVAAETSSPSRGRPRGSSGRNGRPRGRSSWRRRGSGQRRRSGNASRESRRRGNSRARQSSNEWRRMRSGAKERGRSSRTNSRRTSHELQNRMTSAERIQDSLSKKERRIHLRIECCQYGTEFGSSIKGADQHGCYDAANYRSSLVNEKLGNRMANHCFRQFLRCCDVAFLQSDYNRRLMKPRDRAREKSDEKGDELELGQALTESDIDSERRFQSQRLQPPRRNGEEEEGEEEDGPARFDKADNDQDNGGGGTVGRSRDDGHRGTPQSSGKFAGEKLSAIEEIEDFDDRTLGGSSWEGDDEEDDEDEEEREDGVDSDYEEDEDEKEDDKLTERRQQSRWRSSERPSASRYRGNQGQRSSRARNSRNRNFSVGWRGSREGRRNSRGRSSRQNRLSRRRSRERYGQYRSVPTSRTRGNRRSRGRNSQRNSRSYSGGFSRRQGRYSQGKRESRENGADDGGDYGAIDMAEPQQGFYGRGKTSFDSKEQREAYKRMMSDGMSLVSQYYKK